MVTANQRDGFTLIELSIVLVIIGLLIGGILVGQKSIQSAQINAQIRQFQQFDIALNNFEGKFKCLPGDCGINFGTKPGIGNGNGWIEGNGPPGNNMHFEVKSYFPDLSESGMLSEKYRNAFNQHKRGVTYPFGKIGKGGIMIHSTQNKVVQYFLA